MCYNVLHSQMFLILWQLEFRTPLARIFLALGVYQVRLNRKDLEPEYLKTLFPQEPWRRLCYLDTPSVKKVGRSGAGFCKRICTIYDRYTWYMSAYNRYIEIHIRIFTLKSGTGLVFGMLFFFLFFVCLLLEDLVLRQELVTFLTVWLWLWWQFVVLCYLGYTVIEDYLVVYSILLPTGLFRGQQNHNRIERNIHQEQE